MLNQTASPSRRFDRRIKTPARLLVSWSCSGVHGHEEVSQVRDLGLGGLFIATNCRAAAIGAEAQLEFLVSEGVIRAKALVRHVDRGRGLGLEFTALSERDFSRLNELMNRLRGVLP